MQSRLTRCFALASLLGVLSTTAAATAQSKQLVSLNQPAPVGAPTSRAKSAQAESKDKFTGANGSGTLLAMIGEGKELGQCPLKHTDVHCDISGYVARVTVKQTFHNPFKDKIEAVYTFPLSDSGAIDEMLMKVGNRTIHGSIKKREEAREIYNQARANGQIASLLDQERTNIFTQAVANIEPGKEIEITIKYVETLPFEKGKYTFAFPTVVGPRFMPSGSTSTTLNINGGGQSIRAGGGGGGGGGGTGTAADTDQVPDASRISPPVVSEQKERAGHDISINVHLDAGMPLSDVNSQLHQVNVKNAGSGSADISLVDKNTIPNKDFVLSWNVAQNDLKSGYLTYHDPKDKDGYFTVMLVPPKLVTPDKIAPKEMIFVIDCSGSQRGKPLEKCKETMNYILDHMNAEDTFQIISFSSTTKTFADHPQKVSAEMKSKAHEFIASLQANGGTWMAPAVEQACNTPADDHRLRIVTFMTDGYVGNDFEILAMIKKYRGTSRWFPFGTGNSVNRMLIDGMAKEGGGEPDYVLLNSSGEEAGKKFYDRIAAPVLTDVKVAYDGVKVKDVYPKEEADVWAQRPLYIKGKYTSAGAGTITLTGYAAGKPYTQKLSVNFPASNTTNEGIASLWARAKVDRLMSEDYLGAQHGGINKELRDEIVETALAHHIMTQYTSFVAVDEKTVTKNGKVETIAVPVEMPDGVSREGVFGKLQDYGSSRQAMTAARMRRASSPSPSPYLAAPAPTGMYSNYGSASGLAPMSFGAKSMGRSGGGGGEGRGVWVAGRGEAFNSLGGTSIAQEAPLASPSQSLALDLKAVDGAKKSFDKLSPSVKQQINESKESTKDQTRQGAKVLVVLKIKKLTEADKAKLDTLGFKIVKSKNSNGELSGEIKGWIQTSRLKALADLDFVLYVSLDSDRK